MLKKIMLLVVVYVICHVAYDAMMRRKPSAATIDKNMTKIAVEVNAKLPRTEGPMRIDSVDYSERMMRFSVTVLEGNELDKSFKDHARKVVVDLYCANPRSIELGIGVEYTFKKAGLKSFNSKVTYEEWSTTAGPENCVSK